MVARRLGESERDHALRTQEERRSKAETSSEEEWLEEEPAPEAAGPAALLTEPEEKKKRRRKRKKRKRKNKNLCLTNCLKPRTPQKSSKKQSKSLKRKRKRKREKEAWKDTPLLNPVILIKRPDGQQEEELPSVLWDEHTDPDATRRPANCTARQTRQLQQLRGVQRQSERRFKSWIDKGRCQKGPDSD